MIDHVSHHARTESSANRYLVVPAGALNPFNSRLAWQSTLFRYVPVTEFATTQGASLPLGQSPCQAIYSIRARSEAGRNPEEINPQLYIAPFNRVFFGIPRWRKSPSSEVSSFVLSTSDVGDQQSRGIAAQPTS